MSDESSTYTAEMRGKVVGYSIQIPWRGFLQHVVQHRHGGPTMLWSASLCRGPFVRTHTGMTDELKAGRAPYTAAEIVDGFKAETSEEPRYPACPRCMGRLERLARDWRL